MPSREHRLQTLIENMAQRIEKLESSRRRYMRGFAAVIVSAAFALPFIPSDTNAKGGGKTLVAERLALMSGPKKVGMLLSARDGKNKISFHGPKGNVRMTLSTNAKGQPMISLNDPKQNPRLNLRYTKKHGAHWLMFGDDGKAIVKRMK